MKTWCKKAVLCCVLAGGLCGSMVLLPQDTVHCKKKCKKMKHKKKRTRRKPVQQVRETRPLTIQEKIEKIARSISGQVSVSALHVETGRHYDFNENIALPMASVSKLAIALCCLQAVDEGRLSLDDKIPLRAKDLWQIDRADERRLQKRKVIYRTLAQLIELMMQVSDNPSTDVVLRLVGGVDAVNEYLVSIDAEQIHLDRTILQLVCDYSGFKRPEDPYGCTYIHYRALQAHTAQERQKRAEMKFYDDERDRATAAAMTDLLHKLYEGSLLSEESTDFLLECMSGATVCGNRLGGALPEGAQLMHKSGTMLGVTEYAIINDVGIIKLPQDKGHIIVSVLINKSNSPRHVRTQTIARIARALCEHGMKEGA